MNENNQKIATLLRSIAIVYTLQNAIRFRIIAYEKAAETIQFLPYDIKELWKKGQLSQVQGIGATLTQHLDEYFKDPENSYLQKTLKEVPETVFLFMNIPGIGPKKAIKLIQAFKLDDPKTAIEQLKKVGEEGRIAELDSFGKKSETEILEALKIYETHQDKEKRVPYPIAYDLAQDVITYMKLNSHVKKIETLGSLRRKKSTIGDVDLALVIDDEKNTQDVIQHFVNYPKKLGIEGQGDKKASIIAYNGMGVDLRVSSEKIFGSMLQYFTGNKQHNIELRELALKKGLSLSEWGILKIGDDKTKIKDTSKNEDVIQFNDEKKFYNYLGLDYIEPELRESTGEIKAAVNHSLPHLIERDDLKGDFHIHTSYPIEPSHDLGSSSPEELIKEAISLGYEYMGFSDHNPSVSNHTDKQVLDILEKRYQVLKTLFKKPAYKNIDCYVGLEVDILPDGNLALPKGSEEFLDYIIVSVHSRFNLSQEESTKRVLKALEFPKVKIYGHPTGRLIEKRDGINADWDQIFKICAEKNIACEINASPYRLDLPDMLVKQAKQFNVKFTIDSDTHGVGELDNLHHGISVARRGWLEKKDVITTWSKKDLRKWIEG